MTPASGDGPVTPTCPWCGSEMKTIQDEVAYMPPAYFVATCKECGACGPPSTSHESALAAASRPAHPARELTDVQMEGCVHVGLNEISAEQFSMSWVRGSKGEKNINEIRAAIRVAVARALAIVRGET